jgi:hypothetical protein
MSVLLLQMVHAEDVEDLGGLDGALPEATEVNPVPPSDAGEGTSVTPAPTAASEGPALAPAPTGEDALRVVAEPAAKPAAEDPTDAAGPSQVAE